MVNGIGSSGDQFKYEKVGEDTMLVYDKDGNLVREEFALDGAKSEDGGIFYNYIREYSNGQLYSETFTDAETGEITEILANPEEQTEEV